MELIGCRRFMNNELPLIILLGSAALIALLILITYLMRLRARRLRLLEHNIPWHFAAFDFGAAADRPLVLPLVVRRGASWAPTRPHPR